MQKHIFLLFRKYYCKNDAFNDKCISQTLKTSSNIVSIFCEVFPVQNGKCNAKFEKNLEIFKFFKLKMKQHVGRN